MMNHAQIFDESFPDSTVGTLPVSEVTVVIPTLNERATIFQLLEQLQNLYNGIRVLVVDDSSSDGTGELVARFAAACGPHVSLLERTDRTDFGLTASVLDGLRQVSTEYFIVMDGDLQHPPETVQALCSQLAGGAELSVARRLPYIERQGLHRVFMTQLSTWLAKGKLKTRGLTIADPMSGFFGGHTKSIRRICAGNAERFERSGYKVLFDLLRIAGNHLTVQQVPYHFGVRPGGTSKLRPAHALYFLRSLFR